MRICSVDIGTTGTKVILFDENGKELSAAFEEYPVILTCEGWVEQDSALVFKTVLNLLGRCLCNADSHTVDAIVLSVQGDAIIPVEQGGEVLMHAILGMDNRSVPQAEWCERTLGAYELFCQTGMRPGAVNSATKIMWLQQNRPDIARKTVKYLTYDSFILKQLGADEYVTDITMASRSMMYQRDGGGWNREILERLSIEEGKLAHIVFSGAIVGKLHRGIAEKLSLTREPYLITGGHDQTCAGVGAGAVSEGIAVDSHGTAEVLSTSFVKLPDAEGLCNGFYPCYRHAAAGRYFTFALNHSGGVVFRWFRDVFAQEEIGIADGGGRNAYDSMADAMSESPSDLLFIPHLNGSGTPYCDPRSRGTITGLTLSTAKSDVTRALLEGLAFETRLNVIKFEEIGIPVKDIRCVGGGASHKKVLQIKADVLNRPIHTMENREAASLGAAIIGMTGMQYFKTVEEGVGRLVKIKDTYLPNEKYTEIYREKFNNYCNASYALQPVFKAWR